MSKVALVVLALTLPLATWWLVGPLDESAQGTPPHVQSTYDYIVRPPAVDPATERVIGLGSLLAAALSLLVVARAWRRQDLNRRWLPVAVCVLLSAVVIGVAGRVITAGTSGANIGGGIVMLVVSPALFVYWTATAIRLVRAGSRLRDAR